MEVQWKKNTVVFLIFKLLLKCVSLLHMNKLGFSLIADGPCVYLGGILMHLSRVRAFIHCINLVVCLDVLNNSLVQRK